jgi:hypothetical protein
LYNSKSLILILNIISPSFFQYFRQEAAKLRNQLVQLENANRLLICPKFCNFIKLYKWGVSTFKDMWIARIQYFCTWRNYKIYKACPSYRIARQLSIWRLPDFMSINWRKREMKINLASGYIIRWVWAVYGWYIFTSFWKL